MENVQKIEVIEQQRPGQPLRAIEVPDPEFVKWMAERAGWKCPEAALERPVCISPFIGCFGLGGYVVAINGTPAKVLMLIDLDNRYLWVLTPNRVKTYTEGGQPRIWRDFVEFLKKHNVSFGRYMPAMGNAACLTPNR